jgi:hypothetical protein
MKAVKRLVYTLLAALAVSGPVVAQPTLYSVSPNWAIAPDLLRVINPVDGSTISSVAMTNPDGAVLGANGLATHPVTGQLYAVLQIQGLGRTLVTVIPLTGVTASVGVLVQSVAGLAFDGAGTLYGVTGNGDPASPETLYTVSTADASMTLFLTLGNGADGETIGYNPDDGLMYHASGCLTAACDGVMRGDKVWEAVDLLIPAVVSTVLLPEWTTGKDIPEEILAFTYLGGSNFLMADRVSGGINFFSGFFIITTAGVTTFLGEMDQQLQGPGFRARAGAHLPVGLRG